MTSQQGARGDSAPCLDHPSVLAIVLNWNRPELSVKCVQHVLAQQRASADVLIVDNGSTDDSVERFRRSGLSADVLALPVNEGFAGGMNAGLWRALENEYEYAWLLNNDAFAAPDCLHALLTRITDDPAVAMVTPRIVLPTGIEQHAGGTVDLSTAYLDPKKAAELESPRGEGYWLTGTAVLVRLAAIRAVGLFEPAFFAYWEDVDLSTRLTRRGSTLASVPTATVVHAGGASGGGLDSPFVWFLVTRNQWLYLARHGRGRASATRWLRYVVSILRGTTSAEWNGMRMTAALVNAMLAGVSAARRNQFGPPPYEVRPAPLERLLHWQTGYSIRLLQAAAKWLERSQSICPC
jgi:GT2 family glycosyltransferase